MRRALLSVVTVIPGHPRAQSSLRAVGFAAGFFGPILLNPDANQGPMLGIFITGPGGAFAGFILGALARMFAGSTATITADMHISRRLDGRQEGHAYLEHSRPLLSHSSSR